MYVMRVAEQFRKRRPSDDIAAPVVYGHKEAQVRGAEH
jgi:hypothetical protein